VSRSQPGLRRHATYVQAIPSEEILLDEPDLGTEARRSNRHDEPRSASAQDDKVVAACRLWVLPVRGPNMIAENTIVFVSRQSHVWCAPRGFAWPVD
jgi:hypothetical protein